MQTIKEKESVYSSKEDYSKYFKAPSTMVDKSNNLYQQKTKDLYFSEEKTTKNSKIFGNLPSFSYENMSSYRQEDVYSSISKSKTNTIYDEDDKTSGFHRRNETLSKNNSGKIGIY